MTNFNRIKKNRKKSIFLISRIDHNHNYCFSLANLNDLALSAFFLYFFSFCFCYQMLLHLTNIEEEEKPIWSSISLLFFILKYKLYNVIIVLPHFTVYYCNFFLVFFSISTIKLCFRLLYIVLYQSILFFFSKPTTI
jgi:hypothetical protein